MNLKSVGATRIIFAAFLTIAIWLFLHIGLEVTEDGPGDPAWIAVDRWLVDHCAEFRSDQLTDVMVTMTSLGSTLSVGLLAIVSLLVAQFRRLNAERNIVLCVTLLSVLFIRSSKHFFARVRPDPNSWLVSAAGHSFPSGHSAGSFAIIGALFFILGRGCPEMFQRWIIWSLGFIFVLVIGFSRVYLGVHYPTDVLGGFLLGLAIFLFSIACESFCSRIRKRT